MQFSDTSNKNGLIQECEFWTGLGDAGVSGNSTFLKQFTSRINSAFDRLIPSLLSMSRNIQWDDLNHTDLPIGTFNLVSGQGDYTIAEDANTLDIFNITEVRIYASATDTTYRPVEIINADHPLAYYAMSPSSTETGTPTHVLKRGNTLHFYPTPNYNATSGGKIFFEREQSYFASTDTTKEPGFPKPFHALLALYASHDWLTVNKPENQMLITRLEAQIQKREKGLQELIRTRYPSETKMTPRITPYV